MEDLYRERILDYYENPPNRGALPGADISREEDNPLCGDRVRVDLKLNDNHTAIASAGFTGDGCIISQASAAMLIEDVMGKSLDEAESIEPQYVLDLVGIPLTAARVKCALLSLKALKAGIKLWRAENKV